MSASGLPPPPPPPGAGDPPPAPLTGSWARPADERERRQATFGQRAGAWLIDAFIFAVPGFVLVSVLTAALPRGDPEPCRVDGRRAICEPLTGTSIAILVVLSLALVAAWLVYLAATAGANGNSIGLNAISLRLVDAESGEPIGFGRGLGRALAMLLSVAPLFLGCLWMLWDHRNETWHDKIARTRVVTA